MPVILGTVAGVGLDYLGFAGKVSRREALSFAGSQRAAGVAATRWITVFHRGADLSELDAECLQAMKARMRQRIARAQAEQPFRMILVADSPDSQPVVARWRGMTHPDPNYASKPESARSIEEACRMHGLTPQQTAVAMAEIESDLSNALDLSPGQIDHSASQ